MCMECYERTVMHISELCKTVFFENEPVWRGTYLLDTGDFLKCHDCRQFDEDEWEWDSEENRVVGSVYYDIVDKDGNQVDGGEYGYTRTTTFDKFICFVEEANAATIIQKTSDEE